MTLSDLVPGERGIVLGWLTETPPQRLMEMGLLPGTEVKLVRFAPLGDPVDLLIRGFHLSIRKSEARLVEIESIPSSRS